MGFHASDHDKPALANYEAGLKAAVKRIAEIDAMFEQATGWGSWMVECANEREALADKYQLPHKYQARSEGGGRVD